MKLQRWMLPPLLLLQCAWLTSSQNVASSYGKYINTPCTASSDCGLDNHLQCINNYCQCDHLTQIYDQSTHKCLLLLRQQCQSPHGTNIDKNHHQLSRIRCVPNADCVSGRCTCHHGYKPSVDFLCKPDYGSRCYSNEDCDDGLGLTCSTTLGSCQCFNSTWTYQGQFGCVDLRNPQYNEMLRLLNQTEYLLKENNLELKDVFNDLGLQNDLESSADVRSNVIAMARQFQDTYNTNDLQFAAQNDSPQMSGGGFNLQQLLSLFQTFQNLIPRNMNGGGFGRGFFRNLFRGNQGGYPEASTTAAPSSGYGAPGQPEGMGQRMGLLNSFLNLFNQLIPIVRQLRMRFSPVKFIQNLITRFTPTTTPAPAPQPAAIHNAPPTIIDSNGNYQSNPIFDNNPGQEQSGGNNQGQGSFRFFQRTRQRFRNFLRGNNQGGGGGGGGYDYTPANPPDKGYGVPAEAPPPAADSGAPPAEPASSSQQQNFFTNNPGARFHTQSSQAQYSTVHVTQQGTQVQHHQPQQHSSQQHQQQFPVSSAQSPSQRQQSFDGLPRPNTFNSGHQPNPQSFFPASPTNNNNNVPHFNNNQQHNFNNQNNYNGQPTNQHQSSYFPQQNINSQQQHSSIPASPPVPQHPNKSPIFDSSTNSFVRPHPPSIPQSPPTASPAIPQFTLPIQSEKSQNIPSSPTEHISQNFIISEADDPHPGFTPISTPASPIEQPHAGFRTSARFERIGQDEPPQAPTAAQNWADTF